MASPSSDILERLLHLVCGILFEYTLIAADMCFADLNVSPYRR
jgi:hypothetical protein